ncbi:MAG: hypothetical protein IAE91_03940 [Ignavibacteriaceae bacterium]|nr:hypothetical protein [Ignavibacteriaceae bacterium]
MICYLFWHTKLNKYSEDEYLESHKIFHTELKNEKPEGFIDSFCFRIEDLKEVFEDYPVYFDVYSVENFSSLETLNKAAVNTRMKFSHDNIAVKSNSGAAGLYSKLKTAPDFKNLHFFSSFAKPQGVNYTQFEGQLLNAGDNLIFKRIMVLSPLKEYILLSDQENTGENVNTHRLKFLF